MQRPTFTSAEKLLLKTATQLPAPPLLQTSVYKVLFTTMVTMSITGLTQFLCLVYIKVMALVYAEELVTKKFNLLDFFWPLQIDERI